MVCLLQIFKTRLIYLKIFSSSDVVFYEPIVLCPKWKKRIVVSITEDKTVCIIRKLNSSKAYRCDKMSIPMLKICNTTIAGPLKFFYEKCMDTGRYPRLWKSNYCASKKEKQWSNLEKLQA